jgi:hypothetical protein
MILGMSVGAFTILHVIITLVAIGSGLIVVGGMFASDRLPVTTALFLFTTALTSVTGGIFYRRSLDFAHIPMVYGRHVTVVPNDRDGVPTSFGEDAAISRNTSPINTAALLESTRRPSGIREMPRYSAVLRRLRTLAGGDRTGWLGRQDSKLCIPNDRHRTRALPQKGCA